MQFRGGAIHAAMPRDNLQHAKIGVFDDCAYISKSTSAREGPWEPQWCVVYYGH
jgi:hypothetical protein